MLPPEIPLFPLPQTVLFPSVFLPLHIFEARYRTMVDTALKGDRLIGMALLQPGFEADYEGCSPVYQIGCAGVITHAERLSDGRFNIALRGIEKFRITGESLTQAYRMAQVEGLVEELDAGERATLRQQRQRLEALLIATIERTGTEPRFPPAIADEDLVNALAQHLGLDPIERQALLERDGVLSRCQGLIELLQMKIMAAPGAWASRVAH
jgi:Lon protease-like protein